jgi:hypothetical protein
MTKFEYCVFQVAYPTNKSEILFPNGEIKDTSNEHVINILNKLGKEEWELVSTKIFDVAGMFYFKRERNE